MTIHMMSDDTEPTQGLHAQAHGRRSPQSSFRLPSLPRTPRPPPSSVAAEGDSSIPNRETLRTSLSPSMIPYQSSSNSKDGRTISSSARLTSDTSRPLSSAASEVSDAIEGSWISAVIESRGSGAGREVGIASWESQSARVILTQVSDTQTYSKTIHHLMLHPSEIILVPESVACVRYLEGAAGSDTSFPIAAKSLLVRCIQDAFPKADLQGLQRSWWDDKEGALMIERFMSDYAPTDLKQHNDLESKEGLTTLASSKQAVQVALKGKYYTLSACCALLRYSGLTPSSSRGALEHGRHSLRILYSSPEGFIFIDPVSIRDLDLLTLGSQKKHGHCGPNGPVGSLFDLLNRCQTPMGARLLKMNIIQPLTNTHVLDARLDAVETLIKNPILHQGLETSLRALAALNVDLDKTIARMLTANRSSFSSSKESMLPQSTDALLTTLLNLRSFLSATEDVARNLDSLKDGLWSDLHRYALDEDLANILGSLSESLNEDLGSSSRGGRINKQNIRVYAVKAEVNPLLDVARATYNENVEDITRLFQDTAARHQLPIALKYKESGGFHFELKQEGQMTQLPAEFVNVVRGRRQHIVFMSTLELKKLNRRLKDSLAEVMLLVSATVHQLCQLVLHHASALYKLSEALALLDMLVALAHVGRMGEYVRPVFNNALAIKSGYHPILHALKQRQAVPNDVFSDSFSTFFLVTGPNMSGKTTFLKQTALLIIMSGIGSYVPARCANIKPISAIMTRLHNDDDLEHNLSSFAVEMQATAYLLSLASPATLILIDELGRGTSPLEGLGIAHAVSEALSKTRATTFFASHFHQLTQSLAGHPNVSQRQLRVDVIKGKESTAADAKESVGFRYHYKVQEMAEALPRRYGLEMAKMSSLPRALVADACGIADVLDAQASSRSRASKVLQSVQAVKTVLKYDAQLSQLSRNANLGTKELLELLLRIQNALVDDLASYMDCEGTNSREDMPCGDEN